MHHSSLNILACSLLCGLWGTPTLLLADSSTSPSRDSQIEIAAYSQPLHTVCPLWLQVFGRTLVISPRVEGTEIALGPMKTTIQEMRVVLPALLGAAGYGVRSVAPSVDMLEALTPTPAEPDELTTERLPLLAGNAQEIARLSLGLFGQQIQAGAPVPIASQPGGQPQNPLAQMAAPTQQQPVTVGSTPIRRVPSVIAAPDNSLHFTGTKQQLEVVRSFVKTMDVPARLVHIRAIIGHVTLGGDYQSGLDWLNALDDFTAGNTARSQVQLPWRKPVSSLTMYGSIGALSRYVKLSEEDRQFRTDSRPSLFVRSGSSAEITSGQKIAYPQTVLTTANGQASTSATVSYQDVLLRLKVEALVNSQNQITLKITQENNAVTGLSTISGNQVPNIGSQSLTTEVFMISGSTVALGGIVTTNDQGTQRGVTGLRRIPLIGRLFSTKAKTTLEEELIILLEASVAP